MGTDNIFKISVRELIEFVYCSGDLVSGFYSTARMHEGTKAHLIIQKSAGDEYNAEVPVSYLFERDGLKLEVDGRIDGLIKTREVVTIDEIKSTHEELKLIGEDYNPLHWAQVKCYAYMYGITNNIDIIEVRLVYYQIDSGDIKYFTKTLSIEELECFFSEMADKYLEWAKVLHEWSRVRDLSIRQLEFPFKAYRKGQRELAAAVYKTIKSKGKLFAQAPTGTGKTIAALFPAVKALEEGHASKIFYLTAKTITRTISEQAINFMREYGLKLKSVTVTAKEKICFNKGQECDMDECPYAKGYYDKLGNAIKDIFIHDSLTRPVIEEYAKKHMVCPFELSLDLAGYSDCIICDYNYVFDPKVYLKRFFLFGTGDFTFLIDEAHNLVDRARGMFSAELCKRDVLDLKRATKLYAPDIYKHINAINNIMIDFRKLCDEEDKQYVVKKEPPEKLFEVLKKFVSHADKWLSDNSTSPPYKSVLDFYYAAQDFLRSYESYDERFVTYMEKAGGDFRVKLFCLDPSYLLKKALKRGKSAILFSATLTPLDYFRKILGGDEASWTLRLVSPFPKDNLCVLLDNTTSTRYSMREQTYEKVACEIKSLIKGKAGNYIVFFPSYKYMAEVLIRFNEIKQDEKVIYQKNEMTEQEREDFLNEFSLPDGQTLVGFAVLGGIFGEGIDLTGERLLGAVIVGVGLPQVCLEREILRSYFDEESGLGFEYSYIYPGMNKVMQAVGRVIRTESDRGIVLLIDQRFSNYTYRKLTPPEWDIMEVKNSGEIEEIARGFW